MIGLGIIIRKVNEKKKGRLKIIKMSVISLIKFGVFNRSNTVIIKISFWYDFLR